MEDATEDYFWEFWHELTIVKKLDMYVLPGAVNTSLSGIEQSDPREQDEAGVESRVSQIHN